MWFQAVAEQEEKRWRASHRAAVLRDARRLPASFIQHVGAGWDARYGITQESNGSPVAVANTYARQALQEFGDARAAAAYDEELIRDHAENYARLCGRMGSLESRRSFGLSFGIEPPQAPGITRAGETKRWDDPLWWRRQLRRVWTRQAENAMRAAGVIRKGRAPYASDEAVEHRASRARRTQEWMQSRAMVNEAGEQLPLLELQKKSLANPALRRGEFMTRMRGFEEIAQDLGHVALFWTLTAPSAFHAQHTGGGVNAAWEAAARPRVKDAQAWLCKMWARARAKLARLSILFYGFRVAEPHHDATPHWHMVLFVPPNAAATLQQVLRGVWLSEYRDEPGATEFRSKCIRIEAEQGSATGYVAKYVSKNIDGAGTIGDAISDETDEPVSSGVARVAAWAACHGIRQFQQVGGPPVGLWRECRRLRERTDDTDIERARAAADRGDWRAFIYALSTDHIKAGRRVGLKLERPAARIFQTLEAPLNGYGEETRQPVIGLRYCGAVVVTRPHRWRIQKCASAKNASATAAACSEDSSGSRNSAPRSGVFSDLGPVAITVRGDASAALDLGWIMETPYREKGADPPRVAFVGPPRPLSRGGHIRTESEFRRLAWQSLQ